MTWILILTIFAGGKPAMTSIAGFDSKEACSYAAEKWKEPQKGWWFVDGYTVCVPSKKQ